MDIDFHIEFCHKRLSMIWKLVQDLQRDGVPDDSPAFTVLAEKAEIWIGKLESLGALDPGNKHSFNAADISMN